MTDFAALTSSYLDQARVIVVKVGSALLADDATGAINGDWLNGLLPILLISLPPVAPLLSSRPAPSHWDVISFGRHTMTEAGRKTGCRSHWPDQTGRRVASASGPWA